MISKDNFKLYLCTHDLGAGQADPVTEVVGQAQVDTHLPRVNWIKIQENQLNTII
jgi:hypothetical protein